MNARATANALNWAQKVEQVVQESDDWWFDPQFPSRHVKESLSGWKGYSPLTSVYSGCT